MPRKKPPPKPERQKRGSGSISVDAKTGVIRARLPANVDPKRPSREFPPGQYAAARQWIADCLTPPATPDAVPKTLGEWSGEWWATYIAPIRPPNTAATYLSHLRHLAPQYGTPLATVTTTQLQAIVGGLAKTLEPATVAAIAGVWRRCLEAAVDDGLIAKNVARRLSLPSATKRLPARHVTANEVALLRTAIAGQRFEVAFALMLGCGLRIGEILGLHRAHVDIKRRRLWIQHQYTNGHWRDVPKARNPHWVPLPAWVAAITARHMARQPPDAVLVMQSPYQSKAARRSGRPRPWARTTVAADLNALIAELGFDAMTPHASRHGLATFLMEGGIAPPVIAERLGNTAGVILNRYAHATTEGRDRADTLVDTYLSTEPESGDTGTDLGGRRAALP